MFIFEDVNSIYPLITEVVKLRNLIKCPICLDIVNDPVEISCGHVYCSDCIDTFINQASSKLHCPLCKKNIKRQRQKANRNIEQLIKFVTKISEKLKTQFGWDISVVINTDNVYNILGKTGNILGSKIEDRRNSETCSESARSSLQPTLPNTTTENKKDAFDLLMESSSDELTLMTKPTDKTYARKKQAKEKDEVFYQKLTNFENDAYRVKIIDWLCDSKNKFNRLTQTQSIIDDDSDSMATSLDIPSISQAMGAASFQPKRKSCSRKRRHSLGVKVRSSKTKPRSQSFSQESQEDVQEINIEEVESDKDVMVKEHINNIVQMLEEKCLNTIESEVAIQNKEKSTFEKPKKLRKRKRKNKVINDGAKATTSGWIRAKEINKTFSKAVRKPKKLCVSLSSSSKLKNKPGANHIADIQNAVPSKAKDKEITRPVVLLNRLSAEFELCKHSPTPRSPKVYCLDDVEAYISSNINTVDSSDKKNGDAGLVSVPKINNNGFDAGVHNEISADFKKIDQSNGTIEGNIQNKPSGASGSIFSQKTEDEEMENLFSMPTQKIICEANTDTVEKNLVALFSSPEKTENVCGPSNTLAKATTVNDIDNLLNHLHGIANTLDIMYKNNRNIDDLKLDIGKLKLMFSNFKFTKEPINQFKNEIRECINSTTQTVTFDTKSIAVQTEDFDSSGFKISSTADFKTIMQCDVEVQTDFVVSGSLEHQPKTLKTVHCDLKNVTETTRAADTVAHERFIYDGPETSAENMSLPSQKISLHNRSLKSMKDNYQFTESMDNIYFDTQAILNRNKTKGFNNVNAEKENEVMPRMNTQTRIHNQAKKQLIFSKANQIDNKNCINDNEIIEIDDTDDQEDSKKKATQSSSISFSLDLDKCNKNVLNAEYIKKFKRARALMEDSDSDDGFVKKIKKKENPYLIPNLSVEFVSQDTQKMNIEEKAELNSANSMIPSQSLNYDEYLERIMQKFDENNIKTSTPRKELQSTFKQTKSQRIVDKCNILIKQATASPPISPNQNKVCDERNVVTSADIIKEFNLTFNGTVIDEKSKQLAIERKTPSELTSCNKAANAVLSQNMPFSNMECLALEFANELKPLPDNHDETGSQIVILQDIPLHKDRNISRRNSELECNLEEEWQKMDNADKNSVKSEEVFSDCDTDVVETTPQKNKTVLSIHQSSKRHSTYAFPLKLPREEESPDIIFATDATSYFNQTFDPPTEFKDCLIQGHASEKCDSLEYTDKHDITLVPLSVVNAQKAVDLEKTLSEKKLAQPHQICDDKEHDEIIECDTDDDVLEVPAGNVLQQCDTTNSLNPVRVNSDVRDANLIDKALRSNYNPLEIIPSKPQRKEISFKSTITPKKQKSILTYVNHSKTSQKTISHVQQIKPCIACTRLSNEQVIAICSLTNKKLATYSTSFNNNVTHMVVSLKENKCIEHHTMKFVLAVAAGMWVLGFEWIQECLSKNEIVSEAPFEALDVSGKPGPRISRLTRIKNPLLKGFRIHAAAPFVSISKEDIEKVIVMLGGEVVPSLEALNGTSGIRLIIAETKATQDFDIYETWLDFCKVVTVDIEWLSRSVGQYQLLSFRPFTLCSDDNIEELGYPEELLIDTPFSFSQSTYNS